jgi:hypothetical protein
LEAPAVLLKARSLVWSGSIPLNVFTRLYIYILRTEIYIVGKNYKLSRVMRF